MILRILKDWTLIIAILAGILGYFGWAALPLPVWAHTAAQRSIDAVQPTLIFSMLLLTFCRVNPRELHLRGWHLWLLALQCGLFMAIGAAVMSLPAGGLRVVLEGAMICLICPTATAGAVVTGKLGGSVNDITTYTILINLAAALLVPAVVPFVHPQAGVTILAACLLILAKVFPLLLLPLVSALLLRRFWPAMHRRLAAHTELSFYLWAVALALATGVTARSIVHTHVAVSTQLWLVAVSLACCALQFWLGWRIGNRYGDRVTAGQSFGQKNTVLAIWMGYTFFTPVTAVAGGFYSIWHNVANTWQLYKHRKSSARV